MVRIAKAASRAVGPRCGMVPVATSAQIVERLG